MWWGVPRASEHRLRSWAGEPKDVGGSGQKVRVQEGEVRCTKNRGGWVEAEGSTAPHHITADSGPSVAGSGLRGPREAGSSDPEGSRKKTSQDQLSSSQHTRTHGSSHRGPWEGTEQGPSSPAGGLHGRCRAESKALRANWSLTTTAQVLTPASPSLPPHHSPQGSTRPGPANLSNPALPLHRQAFSLLCW